MTSALFQVAAQGLIPYPVHILTRPFELGEMVQWGRQSELNAGTYFANASRGWSLRDMPWSGLWQSIFAGRRSCLILWGLRLEKGCRGCICSTIDEFSM